MRGNVRRPITNSAGTPRLRRTNVNRTALCRQAFFARYSTPFRICSTEALSWPRGTQKNATESCLTVDILLFEACAKAWANRVRQRGLRGPPSTLQHPPIAATVTNRRSCGRVRRTPAGKTFAVACSLDENRNLKGISVIDQRCTRAASNIWEPNRCIQFT